jgi:hypothetical protein
LKNKLALSLSLSRAFAKRRRQQQRLQFTVLCFPPLYVSYSTHYDIVLYIIICYSLATTICIPLYIHYAFKNTPIYIFLKVRIVPCCLPFEVMSLVLKELCIVASVYLDLYARLKNWGGGRVWLFVIATQEACTWLLTLIMLLPVHAPAQKQ